MGERQVAIFVCPECGSENVVWHPPPLGFYDCTDCDWPYEEEE